MDATTVFKELEEVSDDLLGDLRPAYTRETQSAGEAGRHNFILMGRCQDDDFFKELDQLTVKINPDTLDVDITSKGVHITFAFDIDRIENAPPESEKSYRTYTPRQSKSNQINECSNCCRQTPNAYPPLKLKHPSDNPYENGTVETHHLCVSCTQGHFDDVVRRVKAFGVRDGEVERVQFREQTYYDDDDDRMKTQEATWYDIDEIDNPYVMDTVTVIERLLI